MRGIRFGVVAATVAVLGAWTLPLLADEVVAAAQPAPASASIAVTAAPAPTPVVTAQVTPAPDVQPAKPAAPAAAPAVPAAPKPFSPFQIKVGDASVRFGLLLQPQSHLQEDPIGSVGQNMMLRRARLLIGGQATKNLFFFWETDHARFGNANAQGVKTMTSGFQTLDAAVEWRPSKPLNIQAGLIRVPTSRDALESASNEFTLDFNTYAFTATGALAGAAGRDTGVMVRGYFLEDRLEYRASLVSGIREAGSKNAFRRTGRVQYNFFDTEVYGFPSYAGSNFGAKKIVALGAAYDQQLTYDGVTADLFVDWPTGFGSANGLVTLQQLDGGAKVTALAKSDILTADVGAFFKGRKLGPWARFERREFDATGRSETRALIGVNYYPYGNNFNVKAAVGRFKPAVGPEMNQFTVQLQAFYY
jgi:hypothetical protein